MAVAFFSRMAILQALFAFIGRSAGKILNAAFGWAVRALFGTTAGAETTFLTVLVAMAALWPLLFVGVVAPKIATFALTFVPLPDWVSDRAIRIAWIALAFAIPLLLGAALAAKRPADVPKESRAISILRGFPATIGICISFWIMAVTVPIRHVATLVRGRRDAHVPLTTTREGYERAARQIERVLNQRDFQLNRAEPPASARAAMKVLRALGGPAMRRFVPERVAHLVGPKLEATLYPSSLLLRGTEGATTIAHGIVVEALTPCEGFQSTDPQAQEIEREIRSIWRVLDENPQAHRRSRWLASRLGDVTAEIARLEAPYDDWQTVYRQALQLGRALEGEPQLLARVEGIDMDEGREGKRRPIENTAIAYGLRERSTPELLSEITSKGLLLARKEIELARQELKEDFESEIATLKGAAVATLAGTATINLLLVAAVFALTPYLPGWMAALCLAGVTLVVTVATALLARHWHVEKPLALTRKTLVEDARWAKERMA